MKKELYKVVRKSGVTLKRQSPIILTGVAVAGVLTTAILAVKATPNALRILDIESSRKKEELTKLEMVKTTWKCYIPSGIMGTVTIACIIGATSVNLKRNAALVSAYSLTEKALKEYQSKVVEVIGKNKEQKIKDEIAKDKITNNPPKESEIIFTGNGETLCYEALSGRYFKSDIEKVRKAENAINKQLLKDGFICLNDLFYELGLPSTKLGDELGWNNYDDALMIFNFSSQLSENGIPCLVIDYEIYPNGDYLNVF